MSAEGQGIALLLVDLQYDFLERAGLVPDADALCGRAAVLLRGFRQLGLPIAHARTETRADGADRMPHWKALGIRHCAEGTRGAQAPPSIAPLESELVCRKQHYSAFADPRLAAWLDERAVTRLVLAGVYLHACVRSTALDAYAHGCEVWIADDAVGTTEPLHGELTRAWLAERAATFRSVEDILARLDGRQRRARQSLPAAVIAGARRDGGARGCFVHRDPCRTSRILSEVPLGGATEIEEAARVSAEARRPWADTDAARRAEVLERWASVLDEERSLFVELLVREVAKPRRFAEEEAGRAVAHARVAAELARAAAPVSVAPGVRAAARPLGVVGLLTPWNNPLAIPVGKIAPALAFGNGVVLKPAPQASEIALAIVQSAARAGLPTGVVNVVLGGTEAARALCLDARIAAVSLTGSMETGCIVAALCAGALKPLQAELGGNNAAIVLADADIERIVPELVRAAFGFAGQRCTAIRRFVVERAIAARFEARMAAVIPALRVGPPGDPSTDVGPLVSAEKRDRVMAAIAHARSQGARLVAGGTVPSGLEDGAWLAPTLLAAIDPQSRIAQAETFGPLAIVQVARDLEDALAIANGVPQGLVVSVHTRDARARARILEAAEAGIVQLSSGPLAVHPRAPFSGWKASGLGPPEHGVWDAQFYARTQAIYEDPEC